MQGSFWTNLASQHLSARYVPAQKRPSAPGDCSAPHRDQPGAGLLQIKRIYQQMMAKLGKDQFGSFILGRLPEPSETAPKSSFCRTGSTCLWGRRVGATPRPGGIEGPRRFAASTTGVHARVSGESFGGFAGSFLRCFLPQKAGEM